MRRDDKLTVFHRYESLSLIIKRDIHLVGRSGSFQVKRNGGRKGRRHVQAFFANRARVQRGDVGRGEHFANMFVQISRGRAETTGTRWLGNAFGAERKVLGLQRRVRLEADDVATVAQIKERAAARANRTAFQPVLVKIDGAEVFAVAAILPTNLDGKSGLTFKIDCAENVTAVFTFDRVLGRSDETATVFGAKYSHFGGSL